MAIPDRPEGYVFDPKPSPSTDEVMAVLKVLVKLLSNNRAICLAPLTEVEQLPQDVRRHFRKVNM